MRAWFQSSEWFLVVAVLLSVAVVVVVVLYPFCFRPSNRVYWMDQADGLYFDGDGASSLGDCLYFSIDD